MSQSSFISHLLNQPYCKHGVDVIVEVSGDASCVSDGIKCIRYGGSYFFIGMVHPTSLLSGVTGEQIIRKCISIKGTHNYAPWDLDASVQFLSDYHDQLPFERLISPPFELQDLTAAVVEAEKKIWPRISVKC
jgi:threonine dehydrogenase-like Zn-dependent dehydrogenase